jgi:transposase InsO family protein
MKKEDQRNAIAILRHQIISPVLMESGRDQMSYFRQAAQMQFDVPGRGMRTIQATTMKGWLNGYKKHGYSALVPKLRRDAGRFRRLDPETFAVIKALREEHMDLSVVKFYERALREDKLGNPPMCLETLRRYLKSEKLYRKREPKPRKRFEMGRSGELWTGDFMHGPRVLESATGTKKRKAILLAIIDDHSRLIVGAEFGFFENTKLIEQVFKSAIITHGIPDRLYVDNGPSFSSEYLRKSCAHLGIGLVHSKPYDSPSRGKIERWFKTVRESFIALWGEKAIEGMDLKTLNEIFRQWLRDEYHHRNHSGIDARPIDRYRDSITKYPPRRIDEDTLDEFFMVRDERVVNNDSTISFQAVIYEVPPAYIGKRVEIRYVQERPTELYLYENGIRIQKCHVVDAKANGQIYRPRPRDSEVALHQATESSLTSLKDKDKNL